MKLKGSTNDMIRKLTGFRNIEVPEREGSLNELLADDEADVGDWFPLKAGLEIEDVVGLVELDLYLYHNDHSLHGNKTVWVFDDGHGNQHVYTRETDVPCELQRAITIAASH